MVHSKGMVELLRNVGEHAKMVIMVVPRKCCGGIVDK